METVREYGFWPAEREKSRLSLVCAIKPYLPASAKLCGGENNQTVLVSLNTLPPKTWGGSDTSPVAFPLRSTLEDRVKTPDCDSGI